MKTALMPVLATMTVLFGGVALRAGDDPAAGRAGVAPSTCRPADGPVSARPQETAEDPCGHGPENP